MARPASDIRERLVEAARARFLREGVDGASVRDIARDAETSLGIVAYYFPKKEDLFDEVVESVYRPFLDEIAAILRREEGTRERLHAVVLRVAEASGRELDVMRLVAREAIGSARRRHRILRRFIKGHIGALLAAIDDGLREGDFDESFPAPLILAAFAGLAVLPQVVRRAAGGRAPFALPGKEVLAALSMQLFFRAVGRPRHAGA